jgi:hypothetical protein
VDSADRSRCFRRRSVRVGLFHRLTAFCFDSESRTFRFIRSPCRCDLCWNV